jgi:hypothetical protein
LRIYSISGGEVDLEIAFLDVNESGIPIDQGSGSRLGFFLDDTETEEEAAPGGCVFKLRMWAGKAPTPADIAEVAGIADDPGTG